MKAVEAQGSSGGVFASASVNGHFLTNGYYDGTNWVYKNTGFVSYYSQTVGQHQWLTAPSGTAGNAITFTQAMTLFSDGNLLLTNGTVTNAGYKLDVNGTGRFSDKLSIIDPTNNSPLNWSRTGGPIGYLYSDGDNVGISNVFDFGAGYEGILLSTSSSSINFFTNGVSTPRLTIASTGAATFSSSVQATSGKFFSANGTTYASTAQLRVDGGGVNNNYAQIIFSDSALSDGKISYYPAAAAADRFFSISARTTESDFVIRGSGNVGIGTASPAHKLVVEGTVPRILAKDTLGSIAQMLAINNTEVAFGSQTNHPVRILINDLDIARFTTDGYLRMAASTGGIQFNGDTAAANALDDYEEGTWTPVVGGTTGNPTVSYSTQLGKYVKIGRVVHIFCQLRLTSSSGGSGNLIITGLPFTISGDSDETGGSIGLALGFATLPTVIQPEASTSYVFVMVNESNTPITDLDFTYFNFTVTYLVNT